MDPGLLTLRRNFLKITLGSWRGLASVRSRARSTPSTTAGRLQASALASLKVTRLSPCARLNLLPLPLRCGQELKELEYYAHLIGRGAWCSSRPLPARASGRSRTGEELNLMFEVGQVADHFGQVGAGNWQVMSCVALGQG